jgi:hypothetical protein
MKRRTEYAVATLALLAIEVLIALFVHDAFVRPYVGDVLVVIVLYTFVRIFVPEKCRLLPLWIFLFAVVVEVLQYFEIVRVLGLSENRFMRVLIGGTFDWRDIACYALGCALLWLWEFVGKKKSGHCRS